MRPEHINSLCALFIFFVCFVSFSPILSSYSLYLSFFLSVGLILCVLVLTRTVRCICVNSLTNPTCIGFILLFSLSHPVATTHSIFLRNTIYMCSSTKQFVLILSYGEHEQFMRTDKCTCDSMLKMANACTNMWKLSFYIKLVELSNKWNVIQKKVVFFTFNSSISESEKVSKRFCYFKWGSEIKVVFFFF